MIMSKETYKATMTEQNKQIREQKIKILYNKMDKISKEIEYLQHKCLPWNHRMKDWKKLYAQVNKLEEQGVIK